MQVSVVTFGTEIGTESQLLLNMETKISLYPLLGPYSITVLYYSIFLESKTA